MGKPCLPKDERSLTVKIKVRKKGVVILPKTIRDAVGLEEGDEVIYVPRIKYGVPYKITMEFLEKTVTAYVSILELAK